MAMTGRKRKETKGREKEEVMSLYFVRAGNESVLMNIRW